MLVIKIKMTEGGQVELDTHLDDAEITLNICIKGEKRLCDFIFVMQPN